MENSSVIGRLSFLANVVGDGAVAGIQQMARGTGAAMTKLASSVPAAAFASSAAAVAGIGAALIGGTIAAAQFEDSFANVRKVLARASEEELTQIRDAVLDLSTQIPVAAGQLAQLGSIAGQLGVGVSDIPKFIDTVAKLGVATNMSAEQAAFSIARLANVTGIGAENADQLGNVLVRLGNNTAATESEIVLLATRFGAVGKIAGLSADETLAFSASVRATGTEAQAGATALQKFFLALQQAAAQGGTKLNAFANAVGMTGDEFRKLAEEDISNAAVTFVEGLDSIGASGGNVQKVLQDVGLGSVRVSKVMLSLSSDTEELRSNLNLANDEMERQSALNNEAEKRFGTLLNQMTRFRNAIKAVMIDIGEGMVPVLANFVGNLADAISGVREFSDVLNTDSFVRAAKAMSLLTVALGLSRITAIATAFKTLATAVSLVGTSSLVTANAGKMLMVAFKPLLIGGAIFLALGGIVKMFSNMTNKIAGAKRNLEDFRDVMGEIPVGAIDFEVDKAVAESLFGSLEEDTQDAFKAAFGSKTQSVIEDILENTSRNISGVVAGTFEDMQKSSLVLFSAGTGSQTAMDALQARTNAMKENLVLVEKQFGAESEITKAVAEAIRLQEKRLDQNGVLSEREEKYFKKLMARLEITKEILVLQQDTVDTRMEELESLVVSALHEENKLFRKQEILKTDEDILIQARRLAPFNEDIAKHLGISADESEDLLDNTNAFANVLQNANDFAAALNKQLKPIEALQDLEEAKDALSDARKDQVALNKEEEELNQELVNLEREMQDLMEDGKFLAEDIISIKEEELELAELIAAANGDIELSAQEQLKLAKEERELERLERANAQGSLFKGDLQIEAKKEEIQTIKTRGTTEEMVSKKEEELAKSKADAQINANERIIEIQEEQEEVVQRLVDLEEDREDAARAVEKAQIDILKKTNETIIAFADLNNESTEELRALAKSLGMPEAVIDSILRKVLATTIAIEAMPAFAVPQLAADMASLQASTANKPVARASGGPVRIGQRGLVGENGPELIKPMPNGVMIKPLAGGQAAGVTQNVSLNITGLPTDPIAARKIAQNIQRELNKLKGDGRSGLVR